MRKFVLILVLAALMLSACTSKTPTTTVPTAEPTAQTAPQATATTGTTGSTTDCTVSSIFPEPKAPLNVTVPRASADDWSIGPADARMVVIVYSDFQ